MVNLEISITQKIIKSSGHDHNLKDPYFAFSIFWGESTSWQIFTVNIGNITKYSCGVSWNVWEFDQLFHETEFSIKKEEWRIGGKDQSDYY